MGSMRKFCTLPTIAATMLALSACNGGGEASSPEGGSSQVATETAEGTGMASSGTASPGMASPGAGATGADGKRDPRAAIATAVEAVPGSSAVELDYSNRHQSWEVELINVDVGHEVAVTPDGSEVLDKHATGSVDPEEAGDLKQANVSMAEAVGTALEEANGPVDEVSLDSEDGLPMWEIEVEESGGSSTELLVDGMTGELVR